MDITIAQPPWSGLGRKLDSAVRKALYDFKMLEGVSSIAVALSGGKDSLALLYLLHAISGRGFPKVDIHAIHIGGEFTCGAGVNENYLKSICDKLGVNFIVRQSTQKLETLECYSCSRERRRLLFDAAKSVGATTIAFGHHRDDNAQTILMNLLHKGEFCGNLPKLEMVGFGVTIIRPLAYIAEEDICRFAEQHGFRRIMCGCPVGQKSMRKKVDTLLTQMEELFPNARGNVASAGLIYGSKRAQEQ